MEVREQRLSHVSALSGKALWKAKKHAEHGYTKGYYIDTAGPEIPFIGIIGGGGNNNYD